MHPPSNAPRTLSIRACLLSTLASLTALLVLVGLTGIVALHGGNSALQSLARQHLPALQAIGDTSRLLQRANTHFDAFDAAFGAGNLDQARQSLMLGKQDLAGAAQAWQAYEAITKTVEEVPMASELSKQQAALTERLGRAAAALDKLDLDAYREVSRTAVAQAFDAFDAAAARVVAYHGDTGERLYLQSQRRLGQMFTLIGVTLGVSLAVALLASLLLNARVNRRIAQLATQMQRIAHGDLSHEIANSRHDEVGRLFDAARVMQQGLRRIVDAVRGGSETIHLGSSEIAAGHAELSTRTETQSAALQQAASRIVQLNANVGANAASASRARALATGAATSARSASTEAAELRLAVRAIADQAERVRALIQTIDEIARQTGILALNAGIEAARAGESGRGFAVVAREVGDLSRRSAAAAGTAQVVIDDTDASVRHGAGLADRVCATLARVALESNSVASLVDEIGDVTLGQAADIRAVSDAMGRIEQATASNAAMTEQSAAAAAALALETARLHDAVRVFRLDAPAWQPSHA